MTGVVALSKVTVEAQGNQLGPEASRALQEVWAQQRLSLPALCELSFAGPPLPPDLAALAPGASLRIIVDGHDTALFAGEVTAVQHIYGPAGAQELRVRAYDLLHRLRKRSAVRAHVQATLAGLAADFLTGSGIALDPPPSGPVWQTLIQHGQSNLDLLAALCEECGLYLTLRDNRLHIHSLQGFGDAIPLELGASLLEARLEANGEAATGSVSATGWNPLQAQEYAGRASAARATPLAPTAIEAGALGADGQQFLAGGILEQNSHAEFLAQAELDWRRARQTTLWGVAEGNPRLRPGTPIAISGVAESVAGSYTLTSVVHTLNRRNGFLSEISTMPPERRQRKPDLTATLGIVTSVADPEDLGRARVSLPAFGDVETEWLQALSIGGGKSKGLLMLPDVGDRVLILCSGNNPAQGVIVGGLFGLDGCPESGVAEGAVQGYSIWTAGGQRVQLDDAHGKIRLENRDGSYVELSPETVRLHSKRPLEIEAPGQPIVIRGDTVDFEKL